jgi:hypothetical protein
LVFYERYFLHPGGLFLPPDRLFLPKNAAFLPPDKLFLPPFRPGMIPAGVSRGKRGTKTGYFGEKFVEKARI